MLYLNPGPDIEQRYYGLCCVDVIRQLILMLFDTFRIYNVTMNTELTLPELLRRNRTSFNAYSSAMELI